MLFTSPFLCCVMVLNSPALFHAVEAVQSLSDRDRAILTYNAATDPCTKLNAFSHEEEREAADWACKEGFLALDRIGANSCHGWRKPGCRYIQETFRRECSCLISLCDHLLIYSGVTKPYRECALEFWTQELLAGRVLQSPRFQQNLHWVEASALQVARARSSRDSGLGSSSGGAGAPSYAANTSRAAVMHGGTASKYEPETSSRGAKRGAGGKLFTCNICGHEYKTAGSLYDHKKIHKEDIRCQICKKPYASKKSFQKHIRKVHPKNEAAALSTSGHLNKELVTAYETANPYVCKVCGARYAWPKSLNDHKKTHTSSASTCTHCNRNYSTRANYNAHMKERHSKDKDKPS